MKIKIMMLALLMFVPLAGFAQYPEVQHDKQKEKQWRSMETGPWDFEPDWYYYFLHKNYSGAETYWAWHGFKSGLRVRFKESKSKVKRIMPTRIISDETQRQKEGKVKEEMEMIEELL